MTDLRRADLLALLEFVHDATELVGGPDVFPSPVLARLARLVESDEGSYSELDRRRKVVLRGASTNESPVPESVLEERFWRIERLHPLCAHQDRTGDFSGAKLSDFVTLRQLRRSQVYGEWFRPFGIDRELEVGIPSPRSHTKTFLFDRGPGRDFSERDRRVLNLLQPHLCRLYEVARVRRNLDVEPVAEAVSALTRRECEILAYVRRGHTNRQIAHILFISPLTVRRHLENVYEKLGVHSRTAAAARAFELEPHADVLVDAPA